ncbi:PaaI family thioesterase [candidate division WOR-3 bacterium]|nr:PaaI family thioesterase [candidate division WOR-3 bacterium]
MKLEDRDWCFGCGKKNPIGLKLKFTQIPDGVKTIFIPKKEHEGYKDIVHGGVIATLLDESLAWACKSYTNKLTTMTTSLEIKFKKPAIVGKPILVEASMTKNSRKIIQGKALAKNSANQILAEAQGKFIKVV